MRNQLPSHDVTEVHESRPKIDKTGSIKGIGLSFQGLISV